MSRRALAPLCVLLTLAGTTPARADAPAALPDLATMVERMGRPAIESAVVAFVADPVFYAAPAGVELASALRQCGGPHAASGLERLVRNGEVTVQVAALDALSELGLRTQAIQREVRRASRAFDVTVRAAAVRALGVLGEGEDVPGLLDALWSRESEIRAAALAALGRLSGHRLPAQRQRLDLWWSALKAEDLPLVAPSLQAIEAAALEGGDATLHRETLFRTGWLALPSIEKTAREWIESREESLVREALRIIARWCLADFRQPVAALVRPRRSDVPPLAEAVQAARALGMIALATSEQDATERHASDAHATDAHASDATR